MKKVIFLLSLFSCSILLFAQTDKIQIDKSSDGIKLKVNGQNLIMNGMNWDYVPIGTNFNYSLWKQKDDVILKALDDEMGLLKNMGVNTIRVYTGIPKKWIEYIYTKYGIYTMLNHTFGRYGLTLKGTWVVNTEYSDATTRDLLLQEVKQMATDYKDTKGLLLFLLGNENNYGLFWDGAETEDIPIEDRKSTVRAESMYKLFNEATLAMKAIDNSHPIGICNGDLLFLDLIAKECPDVDILGLNVYRGISFGDVFERVKKEYGKPILFAEFGSDAFNAVTNQEDQNAQAALLKGNWKEIYENAGGVGKSGNCLGGFTFQFSDGWWKYGQTKFLDIHDTNASWANGGYAFDYVKGENNMNEEWFGICAKGPTDANGNYQLYPRSAYYVLKEVHQLNPVATGKTLADIEHHFGTIQILDGTLRARGDKAALDSSKNSKIRLSRLSAEITTFSTGGSLITTPDEPDPNNTTYPNQLGFDNMQSFFVGVEGSPTTNMTANIEFNILGNVALNPIDEIFYENRGRPTTVDSPDGPVTLEDVNRVQVYRASYRWDDKLFKLDGFYRTGHYHWGDEGDAFGLYPEANYGPNLDIYQGKAPYGLEIEGKKMFKGFKIAMGPELWWGANPAILLKYSRTIGKFDVTGIFHEDLTQREITQTSFAIPQPKTRRMTLHAKRKFGNFGIEVGGIWGGQPLDGREFQIALDNPNFDPSVSNGEAKYVVYVDKINSDDNWGAKAKMTFTKGAFQWYGSAAYQGLAAFGGADQTKTFTGWRLKDTGSGNQTNILSGFTYQFGNFQIAPNFLWQKPLVDAMPNDVQAPGRLRNIQDDPFAVRVNRETTAGELLLSYDPTPGTWMYEWDNDRAEDAKFAFNLGFVYRHQPTAQDAAIGFLSNRTSFAFPNSAPAQDLWEVNSRIVSKASTDLGLIANMYFGNGQANGGDTRLIERFGGDIRLIYNKIKLIHFFKINDWGPFDYHRDFNLTYPVQLMLDLSTSLGKPDWFILPNTQIGIRGTWRSLDQYSNRYSPNAVPPDTFPPVPPVSSVGFPNGNEWEIRTYIHINIGN
jgi:hypothetical protein